jgi:hypothetical protein
MNRERCTLNIELTCDQRPWLEYIQLKYAFDSVRFA